MLLRGDTIADADLSVRKRMVDRPYKIINFALELADKRGCHPVRPRLNLYGVCSDIESGRLRCSHPTVNREQGYTLTVQGDFNLLFALCVTKNFAFDGIVRHDMKDVLAIGWEVVDYRKATTGPEGRTLDPVPL